METEVTTNNQDTGQTAQQESQTDSNVDYKALYLEEVQNSKKLRKRSQEAEMKVTEFTTAQETNRVKQMKEQEKYQELSEELQKKLDSTMPYKEKWEAHETAQREKYLSKLPKADREKFANESLQVLEYMAEKLNDSTTQPTQHKPAQGRNVNANIDVTKMNSSERTENWDAVLGKYGIENIKKK
tara:strand:+ start:8158 stop:8712 length:555 start_codon:yes stop_codon:yes gene_type:complete